MTYLYDNFKKEKLLNNDLINEKASIKKEIQELNDELNNLISDKELLEWARENHPYIKELNEIEKEIDLKYKKLEELK